MVGMQDLFKHFLASAAIFLFSSYAANSGAIDYDACCSDPDRPTRGYAQEYLGPMVDTHAHLDPGTSSSYKQYIKNLVATGELRNLILMPTPNHGKMHNSAQSVRDAEKLSKETDGKIKTNNLFVEEQGDSRMIQYMEADGSELFRKILQWIMLVIITILRLYVVYIVLGKVGLSLIAVVFLSYYAKKCYDSRTILPINVVFRLPI